MIEPGCKDEVPKDRRVEEEVVQPGHARRCPEDNQIDLNHPLKDQFNLLRTVDNVKYPRMV
jgi:hypothetical protein